MATKMKIEGSTALVTGANRGLGKAYVEALLAAGAAKVYAGMRQVSDVSDARVTPVKLDVTSEADVHAVATACTDVNLLINNAGAMLTTAMMAEGSEQAMRTEMEVNVYGMLRMIKAFIPALIKNGGGAIANMLSVASWYVNPINGTYCASKHAALAVTEGARIELKSKGIHVLGIFAGFIETDMASSVAAPKVSPRHVAERALEGIRMGLDSVYADDRSREMRVALNTNAAFVEADVQKRWDEHHAWV